MTIDEAIIHAESEVWKNEREADRCSRHGGSAYEEKAKSCRACANEHRQLAEWLKELKAYRKTYPYGVEGYPPRAEPSNSEKPNNCETCKWGEWYRQGYDITMMDDECGGCCSWNSKWTPKTEPQTNCVKVGKWYSFTDYVVEMQGVNKPKEFRIVPQTDCGDFADRLAYERGVKHAWEVAQKVFDSTVTFYEAEDVAKQIANTEPTISKMEQVEDEPQTDCSWR